MTEYIPGAKPRDPFFEPQHTSKLKRLLCRGCGVAKVITINNSGKRHKYSDVLCFGCAQAPRTAAQSEAQARREYIAGDLALLLRLSDVATLRGETGIGRAIRDIAAHLHRVIED